jgi:serine protease inhibitor
MDVLQEKRMDDLQNVSIQEKEKESLENTPKSDKKLIIILVVVVALLFVVAGLFFYFFSKKETDPIVPFPEPEPVVSTEEYEINLFKQSYFFSKDNNITNTVISPLSIKMAMAMVTEGADGTTLQELQEVLGLNENSKSYYKDFLKDVSEIENITLSIANSTWANQSLEFKQEFMDILDQYYNTEASSLDFTDPLSVDVINDWVSENTNEKISGILNEINPDAILYLINAIYFNADWTEQFNENLTQEKDFTLLDGSQVKNDLMYMSSSFQYQENEEFQAIKLPYGQDGRFIMTVYLPEEKIGLDSFINNMSIEKMESWKKDFNQMKGNLQLPKFKTEYSSELNDILKVLGIQEAFDPYGANFDNMIEVNDENVFINAVNHKTYIDVSEKGTEAAAVTSVDMSLSSIETEEEETFDMLVNRPFFFTIEDTQYNEYLFMGTILDPQQ